jgi:hypothetical protein
LITNRPRVISELATILDDRDLSFALLKILSDSPEGARMAIQQVEEIDGRETLLQMRSRFGNAFFGMHTSNADDWVVLYAKPYFEIKEASPYMRMIIVKRSNETVTLSLPIVRFASFLYYYVEEFRDLFEYIEPNVMTESDRSEIIRFLKSINDIPKQMLDTITPKE